MQKRRATFLSEEMISTCTGWLVRIIQPINTTTDTTADIQPTARLASPPIQVLHTPMIPVFFWAISQMGLYICLLFYEWKRMFVVMNPRGTLCFRLRCLPGNRTCTNKNGDNCCLRHKITSTLHRLHWMLPWRPSGLRRSYKSNQDFKKGHHAFKAFYLAATKKRNERVWKNVE